MPLPSVNINSVPLSYFMNGVESSKPVDDAQAGKPLEQAADHESASVQAEDHSAGELVQKLDVLLLNAAASSTKSLDGATMRSSLQQLVQDGILDSKGLETLSDAADKAATALKELDKFTGAQLAEAVKTDHAGNLVGLHTHTSKAGKAVRAAIDAQVALSKMLLSVDKQLDGIARNQQKLMEDHPDFHGLDPRIANQVGEIRLLCDRRATEINRLVAQMHDFSVYQAANKKNADPNIRAILNAKVSDLLPRQALAMHGTADALTSVNDEVAQKLRPLAARIDTFRQNPSATLDEDEVVALQSDINTMKAAITDIKQNGVAVGNGHVKVAADIIKALETELSKVERLFATAKQDVAARIREEMVNVTSELLTLPPGCGPEIAERCSDLLAKKENFLTALRAYTQTLGTPNVTAPQIQIRINELTHTANELKRADLSRLNSKQIHAAIKLIGTALNIDVILKKFELVNEELGTNERLVTGKEAMSLFEGKLSVSTVVEARARGLPDGDVDPANDDANIVSSRKLGSGAAGTVFELTRTDGEKVVFKGETESRAGLAGICAGSGAAYSEVQQTVNLNIAAKGAAEALDCGHLIVKYSVGVHDGTFGFYMDKANGHTAGSLAAGEVSKSPEDGLSGKEISKLPIEQRRQVKADLMRELNRLQWLDLVTGQMDRHAENYFVHVDPKTLKVTVKGIDNDAGFTQFRAGVAKFEFDEGTSDRFQQALVPIAEKIAPDNVNAGIVKLLRDPGVMYDPTTRKITVDAIQIKNKAIFAALKNTTGVQSVSVPDKIDRATYDALMSLKPGSDRRKAYLDSLRDRLSAESYKAAEKRLDDAIDKAESLGRKHKVVEGEGWLQQEEVQLKFGKVAMFGINGEKVLLGDEESDTVHETICPSYFARDCLDDLFE